MIKSFVKSLYIIAIINIFTYPIAFLTPVLVFRDSHYSEFEVVFYGSLITAIYCFLLFLYITIRYGYITWFKHDTSPKDLKNGMKKSILFMFQYIGLFFLITMSAIVAVFGARKDTMAKYFFGFFLGPLAYFLFLRILYLVLKFVTKKVVNQIYYTNYNACDIFLGIVVSLFVTGFHFAIYFPVVFLNYTYMSTFMVACSTFLITTTYFLLWFLAYFIKTKYKKTSERVLFYYSETITLTITLIIISSSCVMGILMSKKDASSGEISAYVFTLCFIYTTIILLLYKLYDCIENRFFT